jgi:hypothetical protein
MNELAVPVYLDIHKDSKQYCAMWDVYLNGVKQRACMVADVEKGHVIRFKHAIGNLPVRGRTGKFETEVVRGKVEIRRKEQK